MTKWLSPKLILLANSVYRHGWPHQGSDGRWPGLGGPPAGQPRPDPDEGDRRGRQEMVERGFRHSHGAGPADANGTHGLGDGGLNASPLGLLSLRGAVRSRGRAACQP